MIYRGEKTSQISFPLGGIGSGCIGLGGNGRLLDWEIFNCSNKGSLNGMSHFAVKAEKNGAVIDTRILQGDLQPPYTGHYSNLAQNTYEGYGWGAARETLCGMPHFREHAFKGEYPFAWIELEDQDFPGKAELCAWSPFIPGDDVNSSLPAACFEVTLSNTGKDEIDYTVAGVLANPFKTQTAFNRYSESGGVKQLVLEHGGDKSGFDYGDLTLSTDAPETSFQEYWFHGGWFDDLEVFWNDFTAPGRFLNRNYKSGAGNRNTGLIAAHFRLVPGESRTVRFVISWNVPNRRNDWNSNADEMAAANSIPNRWKNWYATRWNDSADSGRYAMESYTMLRHDTRLFHDTLFASTLPESALDGISANLSILKSPTCLRLEDGTFYGWEGVASHAGSCEGSCTHVWNYAQALPFLFPSLERSMRSAHYKYSIDEDGACHFRIMLPLGIKATAEFRRPCVDGQFGDIMKTWRDWKISGDTGWLRQHWPAVKKSLQYAWSSRNYDRWDPERKGVIDGRQHHTLDMELFGPNAWLNGHYLGALKAAAGMADALEEPEFASECRSIFARGKAWTDQHLFNGEYYFQKISLDDRDMLKTFSHNGKDLAAEIYWDNEHGKIKYQIGNGCQIDMHLPQWYASLYGLGEILDPGKTKKTLQSLFKYNFRTSMRGIVNQWRNYSVNDEQGMQICTWPDQKGKPIIPIPYASETMHGFEWAAACHMIMNGMMDEGMQVVESIRKRYDGRRRNPWNEFECGSNYARSMASYALINAFSGFKYDMTRGFLGFLPVVAGSGFRCFWSLGSAWGEYIQAEKHASISVRYGTLKIQELQLPSIPEKLEYRNGTVEFSIIKEDRILLKKSMTVQAGEELRFTL
ncbi:MAG: GH116 family glycosyl-hydrolase [Victivallales bacterium]